MSAQQINISRIESMPRIPTPYDMRNWKEVTVGYDSLVFTLNASGQYLPLSWIKTNTINYPEHNSFGLHTVVGTTHPNSAEAINLIPAVIGASLCGVNKSNQNGYNWVLMCEEFFNKQNGELVYLNSPSASSGDDWWYETMPNVFFYQLYNLYKGTGDFNFQFTTIANRWLEAVHKMGGSTTPWKIPQMNYRAWDLKEMKPLDSGVREPEAAGAIGWILYNAFIETGEEKYRIGAELAMEFLNSLNFNPSYEIQMPYGAYAAARMNGEIGTNYNTEKMMNWCFGNYQNRNWGTILGNWGGYDVHGLIGEVNGTNDYAFLMNTFEQAGALVPLVRYDDRFARAIGKWILNASNASRLFYPKFLPDNKQDSEQWARQYDPESYIAHEAIRQSQSGSSPYATGDAISGGWGLTTLSLYSSSHVGIFGGIIETTNVDKILKLDLLKTDYFRKGAYPSFLFYNPYQTEQVVEFNPGPEQYDIYDAVSSKFIIKGASGIINLQIPADAAVIAVITPANGVITESQNKRFVDHIIVDYNIETLIENHKPRIKSISPENDKILINSDTYIFCNAEDVDDDTLSYNWSTSAGIVNGNGSTVLFTAPDNMRSVSIKCIVKDSKGESDTSEIQLDIHTSINNPPVIEKIIAHPRKLHLGSLSNLVCSANDADNDKLSYAWSTIFGSFVHKDSTAEWKLPEVEGIYYISCTVSDGLESVTDSIGVIVRDFTQRQNGNLILYFPFNNKAEDASGNNNNGNVSGAVKAFDNLNNANLAYKFDGIDDVIQVANNDILNFQSGITVCFWIKPEQFFEREQYPISHGNWENRWKISITNKKIRWTVRTNASIKDLDSETELELNKFYFVTCYYNGIDFEVYINDELDAFTSHSGNILPTTYDLTIGQVLPGNKNYNFKGVLDEIRVYDYGLPYDEIKYLYQITSPVEEDRIMVDEFILYQNYPNPFNPETVISYKLKETGSVKIILFDVLGKEIATLVDNFQIAGLHKYSLSASKFNLSSGIYFYRIHFSNFSQTKKISFIK